MFIKRMILITIVAIMILSCAEKKDPVSPEVQDAIIEITQTIPITGDPKTIDITEDRIYVAEDQNGFSIYDRHTYQLITSCQELIGLSTSLSSVKHVAALESLDLLCVYNTAGADEILLADMSVVDSLKKVFQMIGGTSSITSLKVIENPGDFPDYSDAESVVVWTVDNVLEYALIDHDYGGMEGVFLKLYQTSYDCVGDANNFAMDDEYFYVTAEQVGFYIFDRASKEIVGWCDTTGEALDLAINGDYVYIASRQDGVEVIDFSDKTAPYLIPDAGYNPSYGYAYSVDVYADYLFAAVGGGGLYVFDISDPAAPVLVQRVMMSEIGYCREVTVFDGKLYAVSRDNGIVVLSINTNN